MRKVHRPEQVPLAPLRSPLDNCRVESANFGSRTIRCTVVSALLLLVLLGCQGDEPRVDVVPHSTYRFVAAFENPQAVAATRDAELPGLAITKFEQGSEKISTLLEFDVRTHLSEREALKRIRGLPGTIGVAKVRDHRYSLVVEFDAPIKKNKALDKLDNVGALMVRSPGGRLSSLYYEVIVESDQELDAVIKEIKSVAGVLVAELNYEYTKNANQ